MIESNADRPSKTQVHFRLLAIKIYYIGLKKIFYQLPMICNENKKLNWIEYGLLI